MSQLLDFEKDIVEFENKIIELREINNNSIDPELDALQKKLEKEIAKVYKNLTPWQKTQVARHPDRPHTLDYLNNIFEEFKLLAGDRLFGEDLAVIGGLAKINGKSVVVIGQEKGSDTESRIKHNFGMPKPEGYRKAQRLMHLAERFNLPIICLVDTSGAFPGAEAEARGQAEAIAKSIDTCLQIKVPLISIVIGEGGSGGAVAIAAANSIMMLDNSIYSVISPEGCASILYHDGSQAKSAAVALKLTAQDLKKLGVIDTIIPEPAGGAHRNRQKTMENVRDAIIKAMDNLTKLSGEELKSERRKKFLAMGN